MTEENYKYRTSQILLRNQFPGKGKLSIPIIPRFQPGQDDFYDLLLIGFDKTSKEDNRHLERMVHFFLYDYRFEQVWKRPEESIERLSRYRAVLSPDFSIYLEMAPVMQIYNVFRNRWCGAYWASKGMRVNPTVNWGDESTFDFCFEGIEKGSAVAVSTYMASEHGNRQDQKEWFMAGYNEMLRRIEPEKIICYNTPFPEMQGDIVYVDYDRSSWRYLDYEKNAAMDFADLESYKIGSTEPQFCDTMDAYRIGKGGGSAYGGKWKPKKPEDERLIGKPGTIHISFRKDGSRVETKIGNEGRAVRERHYTSAPNPKCHSNPHDHEINWVEPRYGIPNFGPQINYWGDVPEFKNYAGDGNMSIIKFALQEDSFKTISEFKESLVCGGEIMFEWKGILYGIFRSESRYCIALANGDLEKWCDTEDEILEYLVGGERLRDVVTQVCVKYRNI